MTTDTISVPEIHCDHCKQSIEAALQPLDGVDSAVVDVPGRAVTVTYDETTTARDELIAAIEEQGYDVPTTSM